MDEIKIQIDDSPIWDALSKKSRLDSRAVEDILDKAAKHNGLSSEDIAVLTAVSDPELLGRLFDTARTVKEEIYGKRLVLFAPLYISNLCNNECAYCAFRAQNNQVKRRALTQEEIARETRNLINQGHKRVLMVAGESYTRDGFSYVLDSIDTIYATRNPPGEIRRVNVNIAPLTVEEFRQLKERQIGTYQVFQETYHRETYQKVHLRGRKADFDWRLGAMHRAMQGGINDVGIGVLFGLFDWRFELLAMMQHIRGLEQAFGVGPHTISVPRLEPAIGSDVSTHPPHAVSDLDFRKIVAIVRLAVPYTGIIMSTRESATIRQETFALGVSQISAGSRTSPGGYSNDEGENESGQFSLGDHRPLDEVIRDVARLGYVPSFCTGCYRLGRTGQDFMDMAKPGEIKHHCDPNALSTFKEYLLDYASNETRELGEKAITQALEALPPTAKQTAKKMLVQVEAGKRDIFC